MMETINELEEQLLKLVRSVHTNGFQEGKEVGNEIGYMQGFEKGYDEGYKKGCEDCEAIYHNSVNYERGLNDAWKLAKDICSTSPDDLLPWGTLLKIFNDTNIELRTHILDNYSASEAITRIKDYEEKQKEEQKEKQDREIQIGDQVGVEINGETKYGIVITINKERKTILHDDWTATITSDGCKKTGKNYSEILDMLRYRWEAD